MSKAGTVLLQSASQWLLFEDPVEILSANTPSDVPQCLASIDAAVARGMHAAGFLSYEAASGIDAAFTSHDASPTPLAWFGLYTSMKVLDELPWPDDAAFSFGDWQPAVSLKDYADNIARLKTYIEAGDTYQVNYTMRLRTDFAGNTDSLFAALCRSQRARYCAAVETGTHTICSASPELFLSLDGDRLLSKPMKGTSSRGMTLAEDDLRVDQLHNSEKNRAENIMIVDMIRNDMGRIADSGSVVPQKLFAIERYPTVLQMTSEVECRTSASFSSIIGAMFPCASITGAPKVRTMQIISELETSPRGVYTGCIGHVSPGRQAQFNIAIRTVVIDSGSGDAEYGVGGGIVWDSTDMDEYAECLTKAAVVTAGTPPFDLLETMLWQGDEGYWLLDLHLERLSRSSRYFCRDIDVAAIRDQVLAFGATLSASRHRVRLLVDQSGTARTESYPLDANVDTVVRLRLAVEPVDKSHPFLYHKTTQRSMYESARAAVTDCDDVVLWNQDREVTETTIANILIERNGHLITPPISSGLLAGTYREHLLHNGEIEEGIITLDDLTAADHIFTINSVRRRQPAELQ